MEKEKVVEWMEKIQYYGCRQVVLATRGSLGALVLANGKLYEQSPCLVEATDTMAAGDSFITSFLIHYVDGLKTARDFPIEGGERGVTKKEEFLDLQMKTSLYQAAVFAADNCKRDGSFGFGKQF
jgi:sugar/nucleoside kinase (ribokinase family)